jgi:drug/metabolite transporter (DMT)-like permease
LAYLLAIGSAVFYGAADFAGGLATRRAGTIPVVILNQASGLILLALLLPLLPDASPSRADLLWGVAAGLTGGIGIALLYRALAIGTMAVVAPTTAVCAVTIPVVASIVLGERPSPLALGGIALGIGSIILVSRHDAPPQSTRGDAGVLGGLPPGVGTALISGIAIGFFYLTLAQTGRAAGMWPILVARSVSLTLLAAAAFIRKQSILMPAAVAGVALLSGLVDMLANALYLIAVREGPLSIVVTLSSLYPASTVLLARVVLGERLNLWQMTGVGCAFAAIVLIVGGGS